MPDPDPALPAASAADPPPAETRERLLDAAERGFAEHGYLATSLRTVTTAAGANLAAVHYHFGSKEELFRAVFERRIGPVNRERIDRLEALVAEHASALPPLEAVLRALLEPVVRLRDDAAGRLFVRLIARAFYAEGEHWRRIDDAFEELAAAYLPVIQGLLPHLRLDEVLWRAHFLMAAMCKVVSDDGRIAAFTRGACDPDDTEAVLRELVAYAAAGLRADGAGGGA